MSNIYYVYMYIRENDSHTGPTGSPYYIGKGSNGRAYDSSNHNVKANREKSNIRFIIEHISEDEAFMWEEFWISFFGRIDLGTGCLHNKTNGGQGVSGFPNPKLGMTYDEFFGEERSKEIKKKISDDKIGNTYGAGNVCSEERKKQMSTERKGKKRPEIGQSIADRLKERGGHSGDNNPFHGKTHSEKTKELMIRPKFSCLICKKVINKSLQTKFHQH